MPGSAELETSESGCHSKKKKAERAYGTPCSYYGAQAARCRLDVRRRWRARLSRSNCPQALRAHNLIRALPPPPSRAARQIPRREIVLAAGPRGSTAGASRAPSSVVVAAACRAGTQTPTAPCAPCSESLPGAPEGRTSTRRHPTVGCHRRARAAAGPPPPTARVPTPSAIALVGRGNGLAWLGAPGCCGTQSPGPAQRK